MNTITARKIAQNENKSEVKQTTDKQTSNNDNKTTYEVTITGYDTEVLTANQLKTLNKAENIKVKYIYE